MRLARLGAAILVLAFAAGCAGARAYDETLLCDYTGPQRQVAADTIRVSDDMASVALVMKKKDKQSVALGYVGVAYEEIRLPDSNRCEAVRFSPDAKRAAYIARDEEGDYVVVARDAGGERESDSYQFIAPDMPVWSPDSSMYAYVAFRKGKVHIVVDREKSKPFEDVQTGTLTWSPSGRVVAAVVRERNSWYITGLNRDLPAYHGVSEAGIRFSPDGKQIAYAALRNGRWRLMVATSKAADLAIPTEYDAVTPASPLWSPDSSRLAWAARRAGKWYVILDGQEVAGPFHAIAEGTPVWSAKSDELMYGALADGMWSVRVHRWTPPGPSRVASGLELLRGTPRYSADGSARLYALRTFGWRVHPSVDTAEPRAYDSIREGSPAITADGRQSVFVARRDNRWAVVRNGVELPVTYDEVGPVVVSPAGGAFAVAAKRDGTWRVIVDGRERHAGYAGFAPESLKLSRDGGRVGYAAAAGDRWAFFVDGEEQPCRVPWAWRFHPATSLVEGVARDRDGFVFHSIRERPE